MQISASFLSIKENLRENIKRLDQSNISYLHLDIMDNIFVPNKTLDISEIRSLLDNIDKPKDVHLMVKNVKEYVDEYISLQPAFITFHVEAVKDVLETINYIKSKHTKVGISIKPNTNVEQIKNYLPYIDLVLVMSVEPGFGGQSFLPSVVEKIEMLKKIKDENKYHYLIEVDGGINDKTIKLVNGADIVVVGSYITNSGNYDKQIETLAINLD